MWRVGHAANGEARRPIVVRRAGWADVRGHPYDPDTLPADDRVGLGPGDAVVIVRDGPDVDDGFLDCLLATEGEVADLERAAAKWGSTVAVFGVPHDLGVDPRERVSIATGVAVDELQLPGYPMGDLQPELWAEPPRPPRVARLRMASGQQSVRDVRQLLDRLIASWRLSERIDEDGLKLAASELATNAVAHGGGPEAATVRYLGEIVRVEVDDHSVDRPEPRVSDDDEIGGRGLHIVGAVSQAWGVELRPVGKRVWCEVAVKRRRSR